MLGSNASNMRSFASNAQVIVPLIYFHYNPDIPDYSQQQIAINKSLAIAHPLIVPIEKAESNCIFIEDLISLFDSRLSQEEAYIKEIVQLKNKIDEEFNKLYHDLTDQTSIKLIRNQRQKIVDYVFDSLKFEKQQMVGNFYNQMMNGYDHIAMNNFHKIICNILWKPLLKPFPLGLVDKIRSTIEGANKEKNEQNVGDIASIIILFIKNYVENKQLKLRNFVNAADLKKYSCAIE